MPKTATPMEFLDALRDAYAAKYGNSAYLAKSSWQTILAVYNALPGDNPPPVEQIVDAVPALSEGTP